MHVVGPEKRNGTTNGRAPGYAIGAVTRYQAVDPETGSVVAVHVRRDLASGDKDVWWEQPDGTKGLGGMKLADLPLYGIDDLTAVFGAAVVVTEGEKAADALRAIGVPAVGTMTGATSAPSAAVLGYLKDFNVDLWPDNDDAGRSHMVKVARTLIGLGVTPRVLTWPAAAEKDDAADFVAAGLGKDELNAMHAAGVVVNETDLPTETGPTTPARAREEKRPWPAPMGDAAFHGLAGDTVRALEPYTEADQHGLLVSVLTAFGCLLSSGPYLLHGSTVHWPRLFGLVVGGTGDGRKGESWSPVRRLVVAVDEGFRSRMLSGLSSGEGLIAAVKDPVHGIVKGQPAITEEGVSDKRLMVTETEFARVLAVLKREGNTLGAVMRDAWDTGDLGVLTKIQARATGAHISILGHITPEELIGNCDQAWITNGFLNRFLVVMVRRARELPIPAALDDAAISPLVRAWTEALRTARSAGRMGWTPEGRAWWESHYASFLTAETGNLGAMKARAAPMVLRLAMTYALMDGQRLIAPVHLEAAEEVWRYSERSVEYLFGESTGNPTADVIRKYLRSQLFLTRTEISDLFNRNKEKHEIDVALSVLEVTGVAYRKYSPASSGPARIETWFLQDQ